MSRHTDGVVWVELARLSADEQVAGVVVAACGLAETPARPRSKSCRIGWRRPISCSCSTTASTCSPRARSSSTPCSPLARTCACWRRAASRSESRARRAGGSRPSRSPPRTRPTRSACSRPTRGGSSSSARARRTRTSRSIRARPLRLRGSVAGSTASRSRSSWQPRACARSRSRSLPTRLDDRFRLLTGGARTAVARQRTLLASVEWSHDLLDPAERTLFRRLSVFASPFSLEGAEAVASDEVTRSPRRLRPARAPGRQEPGVVRGATATGCSRRCASTRSNARTARGELPALRDRHLAWCRRRASGWALERDRDRARARRGRRRGVRPGRRIELVDRARPHPCDRSASPARPPLELPVGPRGAEDDLGPCAARFCSPAATRGSRPWRRLSPAHSMG